MAGPALGLGLIFLIGYFGFVLLLLLSTILNWHKPKVSIPSGLLFLGLTVLTIYIYYDMTQREYKASKKYLGDYKLETLDGQDCDNCKVRLNDGYTYDIVVKDKVVEQGKWHLETAIDVPGYTLKINNGYMTSGRVIFINRTQDE
jgi:hypothetical protein